MRMLWGLLALFALVTTAPSAEFELATPQAAATILVPASEPEYVRLAAQDLASDVEKIVGRRPAIVDSLDVCAASSVIVASVDQPASAELLARFDPQAAGTLTGKWEAYQVRTRAVSVGPVRQALLITGSEPRGTMFAIYALCEQYLGVDPLYFWADRPPQKRARLAWDKVELATGEPTFRYRGWFINDEDLLTEWYDDGGKRDKIGRAHV